MYRSNSHRTGCTGATRSVVPRLTRRLTRTTTRFGLRNLNATWGLLDFGATTPGNESWVERRVPISSIGRRRSRCFAATRREQIYAMPVFRYAGVYIGLPVIFQPKTDRSHTELAWSSDTINWHRIDPGTPLIPTSSDREAYDWGCVYAAACPIVREDEIRLYYGASNGPHTDWRDGFFALATLRPDGFAGYEPVDAGKPAVVVTSLVSVVGDTLRITADAAGGSIRVTAIDAAGNDWPHRNRLRTM